jgi:serpin B
MLLFVFLCLFQAVPGIHAAPAPSGGRVEDGVNTFACDLYAQLRTHKGNLFFSPLSIAYALAVAGAGARGETAAQMARTLHALPGGEHAHQAFADLLQRLNTMQGEGHPQVEIANSLWPHKDFSLRPEYVEMARKYYDAAVLPLDYAGDAAARVNAWVEGKTRGRIRGIMIPPPPETRLVLVNAVYFAGSWAKPFDPDATCEDIFHAAGKAVRTPFMETTYRFGYLEMKNLQILKLPYAGGTLSLIVLLPAKIPGALEKLEKDLSAQRLAQWIDTLTDRNVQVFLPKFTMSWGPASLNTALGALGMRDAFSPQAADFSGMGRDSDVFLGNVLHKAYVDVDEQGTTAAAVTMDLMPTAGPAGLPMIFPIFRANRPFIFLIRENVGGAVLFMGRLTQPR